MNDQGRTFAGPSAAFLPNKLRPRPATAPARRRSHGQRRPAERANARGSRKQFEQRHRLGSKPDGESFTEICRCTGLNVGMRHGLHRQNDTATDQKTNIPMAAPNINSVATETTITLGMELGSCFITRRSSATKIMPRRRNGASNPLITAVQ